MLEMVRAGGRVFNSAVWAMTRAWSFMPLEGQVGDAAAREADQGVPFGSRQPHDPRGILTASGRLRCAVRTLAAGAAQSRRGMTPGRECWHADETGPEGTGGRLPGATARNAGRSDGARSWEAHLMEAPSRQRPKRRPNWTYRRRGFSNLLRMGHCAPTAMQTILDVSSTDKEWLVRLSAGMPGGIGNTGHECGAVTSPLAVMGTQHGLREVDRGLPVVFDRGHALCRDFVACHHTLQCREIRTKDGFPRQCIGPVLRSAELWRGALDGDRSNAIPEGTRAGYSRLYSHFVENEFHCAQAVLGHLGHSPAEHRELFDATSAFMGGTLFMGRTCSALAAGVMAIGFKDGEIENSRLRVVRLLAIMTVRGDAFADHLNKFNPSMNRGHRLAKWFASEFGSTQCQKITGCDLSDSKGVSKYIDGDQITRCRAIGCRVAEQVELMLAAGSVE